MAIRYDKKLNQEINKVINNYNAKIRRIEKYVDSYNYQLPEKMTKKTLKQNAYTRTELRRKLNELKRFSQRGIERSMQTSGGYIISKYEFENLKREKARVQRNISRELTRLETEKARVYGKPQAYTFAQMGDSRYLSFLARKENIKKEIAKLNKEEYERYKQFVYSTGRNIEYENSLFRENYEKMLFDLAYYTKYPDEKIQELKKKIDKLPNKKFYKLFHTEQGIKEVIYQYMAITGKKMARIDPSIIKENVWQNYDNLIENIDDILNNL